MSESGVNETAEQLAEIRALLDDATNWPDCCDRNVCIAPAYHQVVKHAQWLVVERDRLAAQVETLGRVAEAAQDYRDAQKKGWRKGFEEDEARDELDAALAALGSAVPGADE